jgi:cytochrome b561
MDAAQQTAARSYAPALIALHWGVLILIVGVYASIELREFWPKGSTTRELLKIAHFSLGITVLALVFVRLWFRFKTAVPSIEPEPPYYLRLAATGAHVALYAFMIVMPLLGWATLSAEGAPILFFGLPIFPIAPESKSLAELFEETHTTIGDIGYFLIGAHAAAALYHHYVRKDDTLIRILPRRN